MKFTVLLSFLVLPLALAFPSFLEPQNTESMLPKDGPRPIDVTGIHVFVPPGDNDLRGPCPGLNALANHNYLPHDGLMTVEECLSIPEEVWGFGPDFSAIACNLAEMYGRSEGVRISLGGPARLADALGTSLDQQGLSGTHNQFESDSSPTRGDYYPFNGNNFNAQESLFRELLQHNTRPGIIEYRIARYNNSVQTNPYFFYGPVEMVISTATFLFTEDIMANFDPSHPEGDLSTAGLLSLFAFISDDATGHLQYHPGHERIPANWYRRPDPFTHATAAPRLKAMGDADRRVMIPGGNMGEVNTFTPMDISELTGGVYTEETLFEGDNLPCFCFQVLQLTMVANPKNTGTGTGTGVFLPGGPLAKSMEEWMCPKLKKLNEKMYDQYPGYKKRM
ncbi:Chloroperoxidase [Mycena alexandri]|uniref:Chloroperoxidase n=1 Tax=Mycena alexandri TaxID=1745969 RepID=A0AAD6WY85_9AGAR|nr:Chloroperoxidase [Mycena alexandri]